MIEFTGIFNIDRLLNEAAIEMSRPGNHLRRIFFSADRYVFDFNLNLSLWEQFDTETDAPYFGIWMNKRRRLILSYIEGDVVLIQCDTSEVYDAEVAELCAYHRPAPSLIAISEEGRTDYFQDRRELFIDPDRAAHLEQPFDSVVGAS